MVPRLICHDDSRHGTANRGTDRCILQTAEKIIYRVLAGGIYGNATVCTRWAGDATVLSVFAGIAFNTGDFGTICREVPSERVGRFTSVVNSTQWRQVNTAMSFLVFGMSAVGAMCNVTNVV